jgi:hypothetical protein
MATVVPPAQQDPFITSMITGVQLGNQLADTELKREQLATQKEQHSAELLQNKIQFDERQKILQQELGLRSDQLQQAWTQLDMQNQQFEANKQIEQEKLKLEQQRQDTDAEIAFQRNEIAKQQLQAQLKEQNRLQAQDYRQAMQDVEKNPSLVIQTIGGRAKTSMLADPEMGKTTSEMMLRTDPMRAAQIKDALGAIEADQLQYLASRAMQNQEKMDSEEASNFVTKKFAASFTQGWEYWDNEKKALAGMKVPWKDRALEMMNSITKSSYDEAKMTGNEDSLVSMAISTGRASGLPETELLKLGMAVKNNMQQQRGAGSASRTDDVFKLLMADYAMQVESKKIPSTTSFLDWVPDKIDSMGKYYNNLDAAIGAGKESSISSGDVNKMLNLITTSGKLTPEQIAAMKAGEPLPTSSKPIVMEGVSSKTMDQAGKAVALTGKKELRPDNPMFNEFDQPAAEPAGWKTAGEPSKGDKEWSALSPSEQSSTLKLIHGDTSPADIEDWQSWTLDEKMNYARALTSGDTKRADRLVEGVTGAHKMGKDFFYSPTFNIIQKRVK